MPVTAAVLGNQLVEEPLEVGANVRVGILLYQERGGGVRQEYRQESALQALLLHPGGDVGRDLVEPRPIRRDREAMLPELHHAVLFCLRPVNQTRSTLASPQVLPPLGRGHATATPHFRTDTGVMPSAGRRRSSVRHPS